MRVWVCIYNDWAAAPPGLQMQPVAQQVPAMVAQYTRKGGMPGMGKGKGKGGQVRPIWNPHNLDASDKDATLVSPRLLVYWLMSDIIK